MGSVQSKSCQLFASGGSFIDYERIIYHLTPGDLIEIQRNKYKHWVLFESVDSMGNVWCYHVSAVGQHMMDDEVADGLRKEVSFNGNALLKYEPLIDILKDNECLQPSLCRINNQSLMAKEMLKTTNNQMPVLDQVLSHLNRLKDSILKYDLKSLNCEHYCTLWKYGIGWSSQVNSCKDIVMATLKMMASVSGTAGHLLQQNGCYRLGLVCLIVSSIASLAAEVVKNIDLTLNGLKLEGLIKHAIAY
ncbi:phospholipase A and acyltransferase 1-like [Oppia nitens]|uniref:phospholipase A and acyltransferase 1-like n=1 Tax=Oppia nitens TaxID=1686743 RepID=UPI0023DC7856|nr:phospholipase A and acyltransferase 1-like [Oppia nitens]